MCEFTKQIHVKREVIATVTGESPQTPHSKGQHAEFELAAIGFISMVGRRGLTFISSCCSHVWELEASCVCLPLVQDV